MNTGFFGGAFDPFHIGHLAIIEAALESGRLDHLLVVPTGLPPHKSRKLAMSGYRWRMLQLALQDMPKTEISSLEVKRPGLYSYTALSLLAARSELEKRGWGKQKLFLVVGSDVLDTFDSWYKPREVMQQATLFCALRGELSSAEKKHCREKARELERRYGGKVEFFQMKAVELSSTELREALRSGETPKHVFPKAVERFLESNKPYCWMDEMNDLPEGTYLKLARYEQKIWDYLPAHRLVHSLNVAHYAMHLARVHRLDIEEAGMAGLLHDCCKHFPIEDQIRLARKRSPLRYLQREIVHGPAAASYLRQMWGIANENILRAIHYHTTARTGMSDLDKIIYLSDKTEFGRRFRGLEKIRHAAERDLDEAMILCLQEHCLALARDEKKIHPLTMACLNDYGLYKG